MIGDGPNNVRMRAVVVFEYTTNPADYPDGMDALGMAALDLEADPAFILDTEWSLSEASYTEIA